MRLLIVTQAVDLDDRALGFFHTWIEAIAARAERMHVICLTRGRHTLPPTIPVHSLGKEEGRSRLKYVTRFYRYIWQTRSEYDVVLVHMNEEYVLLGALVWKLFGKRVLLWRNHEKGSLWTRIAGVLADTVFYTSPQAYVATFNNAVQMPIGIDTKRFVPRGSAPHDSILFLGRLDPVKKPEVFIKALGRLRDERAAFHADVYGTPTYTKAPHVQPLAALAAPLVNAGVLSLFPGVANASTPEIYASHAIYVNLTPSGSFDKTIGEAMSSGCLVVCANEALRGVVPHEMLVTDASERVADGILWALTRSPEERKKLASEARAYIEREHSLEKLIARLIPYLA